jgi:hypothetical protein
MNHMQLILRRSALRTSALESLIAAQHDPASSKFHQWVTPADLWQVGRGIQASPKLTLRKPGQVHGICFGFRDN